MQLDHQVHRVPLEPLVSQVPREALESRVQLELPASQGRPEQLAREEIPVYRDLLDSRGALDLLEQPVPRESAALRDRPDPLEQPVPLDRWVQQVFLVLQELPDS